MNPVLSNRFRGAHVESMHRGAWAMVDTSGAVLASQGDPSQSIFGRSSTKSFQALPFLRTGAADACGLGDQALALALSSHSGEAHHIAGVEAMLAAAGLAESDLLLGPATPWFQPPWTPARSVINGCSGKHAAFLVVAAHLEQRPATYLEPGSPVQQLVRDAVKEMAGVSEGDLDVEIDGCSAPTFRMPLSNLATGIARVANPEGLEEHTEHACRRMTAAAAAHPEFVGGTYDRFDTDVLSATKGRLFSKMGADGVLLIGVRGEGVGLAVKIDDGGYRGFHALVLRLLADRGFLSSVELTALDPWASTTILNAAGQVTGHIGFPNED